MQNVQTTLPVGNIIRGRYIVQDLLDKGALGAAYLVRDQYYKGGMLNFLVLKEVVNPNRHKLYQISLECMALRLLKHQALPRIYQVISSGNHDRIYLLMDYIEGSNLESLRLQQPEQRFSFPQVMTLMAPIMEAVAYLHRQQPPIIHQGIKPANILVPTTSDKAALVGFGIGKKYEPDTVKVGQGRLMTGYEAPEQDSRAVTNRSDVYALGATFYTLLTGIAPPGALCRTIQLKNTGNDPLEPINQVRSTISMHVAESIHHALSLNNQDRFASIEQFAEALKVDPTWKLILVKKREFDRALKAPSSRHHALEPGFPASTASSLSMVTEQEAIKPASEPELREGRPVLEPDANTEESKSASTSKEQQDEGRTLPALTSKEEPAHEPLKKPEETLPEPAKTGTAAQVVEETRPAVEVAAKQEEIRLVPEAIHLKPRVNQAASDLVSEPPVNQAEKRFVHITEPEEKEDKARFAPEPVLFEPGASPVDSEYECELGANQVEGRFESVTEPTEGEEACSLVSESISTEPRARQEEVLPASESQTVQQDRRPTPAPRPRRLHPVRSPQLSRLVPIFLLLLVSLSLGTLLLASARRPSPPGSITTTPSPVQKAAAPFHRPTAVPTRTAPNSALHLAGSYEGTIYNLAANLGTSMSLRGIQQQQKTMNGYFRGLSLTAPFHGSLDASRHIQFTVTSSLGLAIYAFYGSMQTDGTLAGNYCRLDRHSKCSGEYGLWTLSPAS